jgi:hypothetical protein
LLRVNVGAYGRVLWCLIVLGLLCLVHLSPKKTCTGNRSFIVYQGIGACVRCPPRPHLLANSWTECVGVGEVVRALTGLVALLSVKFWTPLTPPLTIRFTQRHQTLHDPKDTKAREREHEGEKKEME